MDEEINHDFDTEKADNEASRAAYMAIRDAFKNLIATYEKATEAVINQSYNYNNYSFRN